MVHSDTQQRTRHCYMLLRCLFAEVFQCSQTIFQFLYFIEDNQGLSRYDGYTGYSTYGKYNAFHIIILCKQMGNTWIIVTVDIGNMVIVVVSKLL